MVRFCPSFLALTLVGCGAGAPVALDIIDVGPARSTGAGGVMAGTDRVALDVDVRAGQLKDVLDSGGAFDLQLVNCASSDGSGSIVPLDLGGQPVAGLMASQISDDPEMQVLLSASAPREAVGPGSCARLVTRKTTFGPDIVSKPVPLRGS